MVNHHEHLDPAEKAARIQRVLDQAGQLAGADSALIVQEPDEQARAVTQLILDKFAEIGTAYGVLYYLVERGIELGIQSQRGPQRGELTWRRPTLSVTFRVLHHPWYAGAYAYGRHATERKAVGRRQDHDRAPAGQEQLFEDCNDSSPLLSRCSRLDLARRDLAKPFAERAQQIAQAEGLDGKPLAQYVKLAQEHRNDLRPLRAISPERPTRSTAAD